MASPSQNRTASFYHAVEVGPALAIFASAVATFLVIGIGLGPGTLGLVLGQVVGLAGVTLIATRFLTGGFAALALARPRPRAIAGAVLVGASFWYLNLRVCLPLAELLGGEEELTAFQARWLADRNLAATLATIAIVPAVCEEVLCRGLLARALAARHPMWLAAGVSAAAFSLLHLSVPRALPTFTLGLVLAWLALESASVWPAVVMHAVNNAVAILLTHGALSPVASAIEAHPDLALGLAAAVSSLGGYLVISGQRNQHDTKT
jgi:membrane protease YdiL (CAAX protease family)